MLTRAWRFFKGENLEVPGRVIAIVFFLFLFAGVPFVIPNVFVLRILTFACLWAIFAASWDLLVGFTGQLSLGHALFFGTGAYVAGLLNLKFGWPPGATIPLGALAAVAMGFIGGAPALRLRGFYLALVTLAMPLILSGIVMAFPDYTGGELGLFGVQALSSSPIRSYYIVLIVMTASVVIMWKLTDTSSKLVRTGIILRAINEDEIAARAAGINSNTYKFMAFAVSGFFAGVAGGLYVHIMRVVGPSTLELMTSLNPVIWTIFGGVGTIYGAVTGVFILFPLMQFLLDYTLIRTAILAVVVILTLLFMPEGLTVWFRDHIEEVCPRCKLVNFTARRTCRACGALLHLEREETAMPGSSSTEKR